MTYDQRLAAELHDEVNMGHIEDVRRLVQAGADVNGRDPLGATPLMAAAHTGYPEMVRLLLSLGADTTLVNSWGKTAQQLAQELGHAVVLIAFRDLSRLH